MFAYSRLGRKNLRTLARNVSEFGLPKMGNLLVSLVNIFLIQKLTYHPIEKCSVLVIDGITIGHPCCGILHCAIPLANNRHRYCPAHDAHHHICCVEGCSKPIEPSTEDNPPRMTCEEPDHSALEKRHKQRGAAFFQLHGKLKHANVGPINTDAAELTAEDVEESGMEGDMPCPGKPETGNRKIRALFGRRRTHNEQIMVRPCGIVVARQTFFGSETTPQTVVSA